MIKALKGLTTLDEVLRITQHDMVSRATDRLSRRPSRSAAERGRRRRGRSRTGRRRVRGSRRAVRGVRPVARRRLGRNRARMRLIWSAGDRIMGCGRADRLVAVTPDRPRSVSVDTWSSGQSQAPRRHGSRSAAWGRSIGVAAGGSETAMGTLLIDKLLQTVVHPEGQRPAPDRRAASRCSGCTATCGRWRPRCSSRPTPSALMKSITPERCQQELQEVGGTDFAFAFGDMARFRVAVFKQRGNIGLVLRRIPNEFLTFEQIGLPGGHRAADHAAPRPDPRHRADRLGQDDQPGAHDQLHQRQLRPAHHHDRRPDRVLTTSTRSRMVNQREIGIDVPDFPEAHPPGPADGPRHHPRRRNARPGDDPGGHHGGRDRPHRLRHPAHQLGRGHGQPDHRRLPQGAAGPDPHPALGGDHRRAGPGAPARASPKGLVAAYEMLVVTPGHLEPDPREQDVPHRLVDPDRPQARHDPARRQPVQPLAAGPRRGGGGPATSRASPTSSRERIENAKKGIFDDDEEEDEEDEDDDEAEDAGRGVTTATAARSVRAVLPVADVRAGSRAASRPTSSRRSPAPGRLRPAAALDRSDASLEADRRSSVTIRRTARRRAPGPARRGSAAMARRLGTILVDMGYLDEEQPLEGPRGAEAVRQRAARQGRRPAGPGQRGPGAQGARRAARHEGHQARRR